MSGGRVGGDCGKWKWVVATAEEEEEEDVDACDSGG